MDGPFFFFSYQENSQVSVPLRSEIHCLKLRGNCYINEVLFSLETILFPSLHCLTCSSQRVYPSPPPTFLSTRLLAGFLSLTSQELFGSFRLFFFNVLCLQLHRKECLSCLKFARVLHFSHTFSFILSLSHTRTRTHAYTHLTHTRAVVCELAVAKANVIRQTRGSSGLTLFRGGCCCVTDCK